MKIKFSLFLKNELFGFSGEAVNFRVVLTIFKFQFFKHGPFRLEFRHIFNFLIY